MGLTVPAANSSAIPARELALEEAAIIAGLVKAPSRYSPTADVQAAVSRANVVVAQMVKYGELDPAIAREVDVSTGQAARG